MSAHSHPTGPVETCICDPHSEGSWYYCPEHGEWARANRDYIEGREPTPPFDEDIA